MIYETFYVQKLDLCVVFWFALLGDLEIAPVTMFVLHYTYSILGLYSSTIYLHINTLHVLKNTARNIHGQYIYLIVDPSIYIYQNSIKVWIFLSVTFMLPCPPYGAIRLLETSRNIAEVGQLLFPILFGRVPTF